MDGVDPGHVFRLLELVPQAAMTVVVLIFAWFLRRWGVEDRREFTLALSKATEAIVNAIEKNEERSSEESHRLEATLRDQQRQLDAMRDRFTCKHPGGGHAA